jgi:hypothetical protein
MTFAGAFLVAFRSFRRAARGQMQKSTARKFYCIPPKIAERPLGDRRTSADVNDAPLGCFLDWRLWLCRKLKHRCLLTLE